jgi:hypothetical protein
VSLQFLAQPAILFFLLGLGAGLARSSLRLPEGLSRGLSLYLMMAIGLRGGAELAGSTSIGSALPTFALAVVLSLGLPVVAHNLLRLTTSLDRTERAAISAHYGSVSVVTFATAIAVLQREAQAFEPFMIGMLAVMEAPAILTGLVLAQRGGRAEDPVRASVPRSLIEHVLLHGSVVLLLGSFAIGWIVGPAGLTDLSGLFVAPFQGALCVFLLDMGLVVAGRASDLRKLRPSLVAFGIYMPLVGASLGLLAGRIAGLSIGGTALLGVLAASASYIVVPAVLRSALPKASPALALTLALGVTFPFNVTVGIPLYHAAARVLAAPGEAAHEATRAPARARTHEHAAVHP